ncbi:MAG: hypothetical protein AAF558_01895, partial [Verrucomicrobiota bacterium]
PDLKAGLGVNDAMFGLLLLANGTGLVTAMWAAPYIDRWLGARSLQAVVALFALLLPLPGLVGTPWAFAAVMACVGFFSGLCDILMNARVSELEASHRRPLMNSSHGMFSVAYAAAAFWTGRGNLDPRFDHELPISRRGSVCADVSRFAPALSHGWA